MSALLDAVGMADPGAVLFAGKRGPITAGQIRRTAMDAAIKLPVGKPVYLHTQSAALFVAGLLAAASRGATVFCPAHVQPDYLREIGAADGVLLTDEAVALASVVPLVLAEDTGRFDLIPTDLKLGFYTSGTTAAPKLVPKAIAQLDLEARKLDKLWSAEAGHVYATVSHQHIYGMLFRIFWPVISGRVSEDRPVETWEMLSGRLDGATLIASPAHLTRIPGGFDGGRPAQIFSSGAPLPLVAALAARERFGSLPFEVLGSTETGGIAWRQQDSSAALWTPFDDVGIGADAEGCLVVTSAVAGAEPVVTGDLVEKVEAQFRLKGRGDVIAKIDGNRVSLPRVEQALLALQQIAAAAVIDLPQRKGALGAIVELSTEGEAALRELGAFRLSRKLRENLVGRMEPRERPKHWLFAPIPLDRQGKRVRAVLQAKFQPRGEAAMGALLAAAVDGDKAELSIAFSPEMVWFKGHFPDEPVLPGIAQTHMAVLWSECLWGFKPKGAGLAQVKFRRIMRPGTVAVLRLVRDCDRGRLSFSYDVDGVIASEGKIGGVP